METGKGDSQSKRSGHRHHQDTGDGETITITRRAHDKREVTVVAAGSPHKTRKHSPTIRIKLRDDKTRKVQPSPPQTTVVVRRPRSPSDKRPRSPSATSSAEKRLKPSAIKTSSPLQPDKRGLLPERRGTVPKSPDRRARSPPRQVSPSPHKHSKHSPIVAPTREDEFDEEPEIGLDIKPPQASFNRKERSRRKKEKREKRERSRQEPINIPPPLMDSRRHKERDRRRERRSDEPYKSSDNSYRGYSDHRRDRRERHRPLMLSSPNNEPMFKERDPEWLESQKRRERLINAERERERQRGMQRREESRRPRDAMDIEAIPMVTEDIKTISERIDKKRGHRQQRESGESVNDVPVEVSKHAESRSAAPAEVKIPPTKTAPAREETIDDLLQDVLELQASDELEDDSDEEEEEEEGLVESEDEKLEKKKTVAVKRVTSEKVMKSASESSSSASEDSEVDGEESSEETEDEEEDEEVVEEEEEEEDEKNEKQESVEEEQKVVESPEIRQDRNNTDKGKVKSEPNSPAKGDYSKLDSSTENGKFLNDTPVASPAELKPDLPAYFPAIQGCRQVEEFDCLNRIEEGTYGVVYRARDKRTSQIVALKRLKMEKEKEGFPITSLREINTLLKAQHPNIVHVREIVVGTNMDKIYIVMDYVEHDLKTLMETMKQPFLVGEVKTLLRQLLSAVAHLHDNWILHRDLKTSNLLLSHKGILKVGDFGLAREYGSPLKPYTEVVVTLWYRAPELLLGAKQYSTPIDLWSVGCIFAELLNMKPLFPGKSEIDQLHRIFKDLGTPNERIWPGYSQLSVVKKVTFTEYPYNMLRNRFGPQLTDSGFDLLNKFLTYNPARRVTAEDAKKHEYFNEPPLPVHPSVFPTWPAKSEQGHVRITHSPKAPSGGKQYSKLTREEDDVETSSISGFHMTTQISAAKAMGFSLKF